MTDIGPILETYRSGFALPGAVYRDQDIYEQEIRAIFLKAWQYVGHQSQIPQKGDYFLFEMAGESVIVVRDGEGNINALLNVCRHRGSRICDALQGHETRLVCRYHGWAYGLDGSLRTATRAPEGLDKSQYGLNRLNVRVFAGMIFINFDANPAPFEPFVADMAGPLAPWQLENARLAYKRNYPIRSNWKLAVENYCECYHCLPAHPEYSIGHGRAIGDEESAELLAKVKALAPAAGVTTEVVRRSFRDAGVFGTDRGFDTYPLLRGHKTGSRDGEPVAPLMGSIRAYDGGTVDLHLGPTTFGLAYSDHVVLYRFTPRALHETDCEIIWLVNGSAVEGRDYDVEKLTWLWHVTTLADKEIIERNQAGVDSRFYRPGPLAPLERFTRQFLDWYVARMQADADATGKAGAHGPDVGVSK
jgi:phenylpropionate dioxygenase-like ring-hydroxylating dioxygenase large terminal subunit